jgi:hypothetical protein
MRWGWITLLLLAAAGARAGGLFEEDAILEATLTGPVSELVAAGAARSEYPFVLVVDGTEIPVKVRVRGNSRLRVCDFPPLRLNFSRQMVIGSHFEGQDKLKLVTHCSERRKDAGNVLDEYLAYRLFNLLSVDSYGVRLLRIRYTDTSAPDSANELHDAFLIQDDASFAAARAVESLEAPGVYLSKLDPLQAARVYVFQYLVGNTDWSLVTAETDDRCCHNTDLFERDGRVVIVPYDFDLSGLVDASYARPDPSLKIRSVRTRRYRGYCLSPEILGVVLDEFVALEESIMETAAHVPAASEAHGQDRLDFLAGFFAAAADTNELLRDFEKRCL